MYALPEPRPSLHQVPMMGMSDCSFNGSPLLAGTLGLSTVEWSFDIPQEMIGEIPEPQAGGTILPTIMLEGLMIQPNRRRRASWNDQTTASKQLVDINMRNRERYGRYEDEMELENEGAKEMREWTAYASRHTSYVR